MKAVTELNEEETEKQVIERDNILSLIKDVTYEERWEIKEINVGYAHYNFKVKPSQKMLDAIGRKPTTNEMIMIVDGGFSHFGASCTESNGIYTGRVNTD